MLWRVECGYHGVSQARLAKLNSAARLMGRWPDNMGDLLSYCHGPAFRYVDFWTACENGGVEENERRAVGLLESLCDEERFGIYCQTSFLPVRGNLTGRTYLIERGSKTWGYRNGKCVEGWCIHSMGGSLPPTDDVVAIRGLIEGNEQEFMAIGNRNNYPAIYPSMGPKIRLPHFVEL